MAVMVPGKNESQRFLCTLALLLCAIPALAKDAPLAVIDWPLTGTPVVRFTFGKFKTLPGMGSLHGYVMETTAENLSARVIPSARFSVYLFDKAKVRVGEDAISLSNVGPGETVRFQTTVMASGQPVSVSINEKTDAAKTVSLTVNSTPQGALLKVDGVEAGVTPRLITVGAGKHALAFSKEGFKAGEFPLEIGRDDVSGGSISYELGAAFFDSIELRDGSVLNGDLVSISGMDVEIRVGGNLQHLDRNRIKRIMLVQRDAPRQDLPTPSSPQQ
ncbi:MAG TPA: PEGA domain-containing protein [Terracidiphilus sp.]|nr:PEGA domain-containing protein [Terracidiphilus sp.]